MPVAEAETALASTIGVRPRPEVVRGKTLHPAARQDASTIFQSLPRRLNNLHEGSMSYERFSIPSREDYRGARRERQERFKDKVRGSVF